MKHFFKTYIWHMLILLCDALILPGMFLCHWLTDRMLSVSTTCTWTLLGGKCLTCGGTHFVNEITQLHIWEAFQQNEFLFFVALYALVTLVMLNLWILFRLRFCGRVLRYMYSVPVIITGVGLTILFLVIRNIPTAISIVRIILYYANGG